MSYAGFRTVQLNAFKLTSFKITALNAAQDQHFQKPDLFAYSCFILYSPFLEDYA